MRYKPEDSTALEESATANLGPKLGLFFAYESLLKIKYTWFQLFPLDLR